MELSILLLSNAVSFRHVKSRAAPPLTLLAFNDLLATYPCLIPLYIKRINPIHAVADIYNTYKLGVVLPHQPTPFPVSILGDNFGR